MRIFFFNFFRALQDCKLTSGMQEFRREIETGFKKVRVATYQIFRLDKASRMLISLVFNYPTSCACEPQLYADVGAFLTYYKHVF